ncbi:hypothetical protein CVU37_04880 [candidate division BRC1 bacterium HGW-BRC1-1]|jgi:Holliday junction resolvasome RuvABC endonuclease subunit|nr:MAG: hypothetical protein CVU37_04880 [candidate division BRC1 bacterium HGW-BRC1-1]
MNNVAASAPRGRNNKSKHIRIVAIDPGTREMGIAVLDGSELIYHEAKAMRKRGSAQKILAETHRLILRLVLDFHPTVLAFGRTFMSKSRRVALQNVVSDEIKRLGEQLGVRVLSLAVNTVRKRLCGTGRGIRG